MPAGASPASAPASAPGGPVTIDTAASALTSSTLGATHRYIIEFTAGTASTAEATTHAKRGMAVQNVLTEVFPGEIADLTDAQVKALRLNPRVQSIEADTPVSVATTQSSAPWGLDRIDQQKLPLSNSYSYDRTGTGVKAYVIDSGIAAHPDFGTRVTKGSSSYSGVDDGLGSGDCDGHGTHVAGIIGGTTYGVAKNVTLVPVRVLDCSGGGTASGIISGLNWVIADHPAGAPAVANLSIGLSVNTLVDNAVRAAVTDGVSVAVAAGNANRDACDSSPSRVAVAITVGATDSSDQRASFSNFGSCVDLFAPGVSVTSDSKDGTTKVMSGTSMATPHVAGTAALLLALTPSASPATIQNSLITLSTKGVVLNAGSDSPNRLLNTGATPPPPTELAVAPTSVVATAPASGSTTVTWVPSSSASILDQAVNTYRNGTLLKTTVVNTTVTTMNYTGMTAGASYTFTVQARNALGLSAPSSASTAVVYRTVPGEPSAAIASIAAGGAGTVTWTLGSDNGSVLTEQIVRTYRGSTVIATTSVSGSTTSFTTPTTLDLGIGYKFTVQARNELGLSATSTFSNIITRILVPNPATNLVASVTFGTNARVTWTIGSNGGSSLWGQTVTAYANGVYLRSFDVAANANSLTTEGMQVGVSYTFTVQSRNDVGRSPESVPSNAVKRVR
jgi:subtilisin family serine protease